ncbi:hypothetical protein [Salinarimonas soli]|uniref:EF-hand domain-containing protein n=1 Tax=Salinarimonas soli TaxID=1638099 RepID=A0A5B2VYQ2_9HYPH|nr:hypothetical protein [Salinarimonas soli]KAA2243944.1 hypothetical protein F0L46_01450 [Salinarimonas soli]
MTDWASWKDGTKSYGEFTDLFLQHAGNDREMDKTEFEGFMKALGVKDGSFEAVPKKDDGKTINLSELVARMDTVDRRDKGDTDGVFMRSELDAFFKADDKGGGSGSLKFADVNKDKDGINSMFISKDELKFAVMKYDTNGDNKLDGDEVKALAKATGADASKLAGYAGCDGYLDGSDLDAAFGSVDKASGGDDDGQLNADELNTFFGISKAGDAPGAGGTGFNFASVDANGDKSVTGGEIYTKLSALSSPGDDKAWQGDEIKDLASKSGISLDVLTKTAGTDGYLDETDITNAVKAQDSDGALDEAGFNALFGLGNGGTGTGTTTPTFKFSDINKDKDGINSMLISKSELKDFLAATKTDGGDGKWQGDEIKDLAKALGVDVNTLTAMAGTDGYLDSADIDAGFSKIDKASGGDDDGQLNADELNSFFGISKAGGGSGTGAAFSFGSVDANGNKSVNTDEIFTKMAAISPPGDDNAWQGDEIKDLSSKSGLSLDVLTKMAGTDGYLDKADIDKAVKAQDSDGELDEAGFNTLFGINNGGNGGGSNYTNTGLAFTDVNKDKSGIESMFASTGEVFDFLIATNTHGGDYVWEGDQEMKALSDALKIDVSLLKAAAGDDNKLDAKDVADLVAKVDGKNGDGSLNADQLKTLFKAS